MVEEDAALVLPFLTLAGFCVAYGIVLVERRLVTGLLNGLVTISSWIPLVGSVTAAVLTRAEQALNNQMSSWLASLEGHIATSWHSLARYVERLWAYQVTVATNLLHLAESVGHAVGTDVFNAARQALLKGLHAAETDIRWLRKHVLRQEKIITQTVAQGVYPRLRTLEHEVAKTLPREIKAARTLAREAEDGVARLWDAVRGISTGVSVAAVTAIVAAAIAALGDFSFLKCPEWANLNKRGCGLWNLLDDVLSLLVDALVFVDLCEVIPEAVTIFSEFEAPLVDLISSAADAACAKPPAGWSHFNVPAGPLPPAQTTGPLAA